MKLNWEKVELFMQGVFFRVSFLIFFVLFIGVFVYAYQQEMKLEEVGDSAPFAEQKTQVDDTLENDAIGKAHRTRREMQVWLVENVSELMNLNGNNVKGILHEKRVYFTEAGYQQYQDYLKADNMLADIEGGRVTLGTIVDQTPQALNDGLIGGKYRWLYDVPVIASVKPAQGAAQNKKITLRIQLGRTMDESNEDKIVIESWTVVPRR